MESANQLSITISSNEFRDQATASNAPEIGRLQSSLRYRLQQDRTQQSARQLSLSVSCLTWIPMMISFLLLPRDRRLHGDVDGVVTRLGLYYSVGQMPQEGNRVLFQLQEGT